MNHYRKTNPFRRALIATTLVLIFSQEAFTCTRAVYLGQDDTVMTGRSMDWAEDMQSSLWVFPRGMKRTGLAGPDSPEWISKYGSVIASGYEMGTADGMNEA